MDTVPVGNQEASFKPRRLITAAEVAERLALTESGVYEMDRSRRPSPTGRLASRGGLMKKPHRTREAQRISCEGSIQQALTADPRRIILSHCPGCSEPHTNPPTLLGAWVGPDLSRVLVYYLCRHCVRRMEKAAQHDRQRLVRRVQGHLEALDACVGLKREGLRA
jgi:hypothetical protein